MTPGGSRGELDPRLPAAAPLCEAVVDHVPTLLSMIDAGFRYRFVNRAYEEWFGHPRGSVLGHHVKDVLGEAAWTSLRPHMERALRGEVVHFDTRVPYRLGGHRHVDATYTPYRAGDGRVVGFVASVTDITRGVESRTREIEESRERVRRYTELTADLICAVEPEGTFTELNPAVSSLLGWNPQELLGRPYADLLHPDDVAPTQAQTARVVSGERAIGFENRLRARDGQYRVIEWTAAFDPKTGTIHAIGRDVTERRRLEAEDRRNRVARPIVRRVLLQQGGMPPEARRELGRKLAGDVAEPTLDAFLDAFRTTGAGDIAATSRVGGRYEFRASNLLETQRGSATPTCHLTLGYLEGVVARLSGARSLGTELRCESQGHPACEFIVTTRAG